MAYTIIEVERRLNVPSRTLRFWASKGLFDNVERDSNGVLYFNEKDLELVIWVQYLRAGGMSIKKIKAYLATYNPASISHTREKESDSKALLQKRKQMISEQLGLVEEEIARLESVKELLQDKIAFLDAFIKEGKEPKDFACKSFEIVQRRVKEALHFRG